MRGVLRVSNFAQTAATNRCRLPTEGGVVTEGGNV